eukprot:774156-Pyramimonas_sp.AAC.1
MVRKTDLREELHDLVKILFPWKAPETVTTLGAALTAMVDNAEKKFHKPLAVFKLGKHILNIASDALAQMRIDDKMKQDLNDVTIPMFEDKPPGPDGGGWAPGLPLPLAREWRAASNGLKCLLGKASASFATANKDKIDEFTGAEAWAIRRVISGARGAIAKHMDTLLGLVVSIWAEPENENKKSLLERLATSATIRKKTEDLTSEKLEIKGCWNEELVQSYDIGLDQCISFEADLLAVMGREATDNPASLLDEDFQSFVDHSECLKEFSNGSAHNSFLQALRTKVSGLLPKSLFGDGASPGAKLCKFALATLKENDTENYKYDEENDRMPLLDALWREFGGKPTDGGAVQELGCLFQKGVQLASKYLRVLVDEGGAEPQLVFFNAEAPISLAICAPPTALALVLGPAWNYSPGNGFEKFTTDSAQTWVHWNLGPLLKAIEDLDTTLLSFSTYWWAASNES